MAVTNRSPYDLITALAPPLVVQSIAANPSEVAGRATALILGEGDDAAWVVRYLMVDTGSWSPAPICVRLHQTLRISADAADGQCLRHIHTRHADAVIRHAVVDVEAVG